MTYIHTYTISTYIYIYRSQCTHNYAHTILPFEPDWSMGYSSFCQCNPECKGPTSLPRTQALFAESSRAGHTVSTAAGKQPPQRDEHSGWEGSMAREIQLIPPTAIPTGLPLITLWLWKLPSLTPISSRISKRSILLLSPQCQILWPVTLTRQN